MRMERAKDDKGRVSDDDVQVIHDGNSQRQYSSEANLLVECGMPATTMADQFVRKAEFFEVQQQC